MKHTFSRGVHPSSDKGLSEKAIIGTMPTPDKVYVALSQHIGNEAISVVEIGEKVQMGQLIARADGAVSSNVFSPCSGTVISIEKRNTPSAEIKHIGIENDKLETAYRFDRIEKPTSENVLKRLYDCGIVGMGGAGFPTDVKLKPTEVVDTLIINGAECEPYITCDYRIMLEYTEKLVKGVQVLATALNLNKSFIAIEDNKPDAIEHMTVFLQRNNISNVEIVPVKTKYPQGAEKQLIYSVTGKKVPVGKYPNSIGIVMNNVHTALSAYLAVYEGQPLYKRIMTVSGYGIKTPSNLWVSNGTLYKDLIEYCGGYSDEPTVKLICGGPMMGQTVVNAEVSTSKICGSLLLLTRDEAFTENPEACINCGKCSRVCPMVLMPMYIDSYTLAGNIDGAIKYGVCNCIECGCCAYACPAKRPLVQSIKLAKKKIKERGIK